MVRVTKLTSAQVAMLGLDREQALAYARRSADARLSDHSIPVPIDRMSGVAACFITYNSATGILTCSPSQNVGAPYFQAPFLYVPLTGVVAGAPVFAVCNTSPGVGQTGLRLAAQNWNLTPAGELYFAGWNATDAFVDPATCSWQMMMVALTRT